MISEKLEQKLRQAITQHEAVLTKAYSYSEDLQDKKLIDCYSKCLSGLRDVLSGKITLAQWMDTMGAL